MKIQIKPIIMDHGLNTVNVGVIESQYINVTLNEIYELDLANRVFIDDKGLAVSVLPVPETTKLTDFYYPGEPLFKCYVGFVLLK